MQLTFTGGKELAAALRKLPDAVSKNLLSGAVLAGAGIIRDAAAARCPRSPLHRGKGVRLADSIKVSVTESTRAYVTANVGTKVPYAHLVEYGHQIVPRGPNRVTVASVTTVSKSGRSRTRLQRVAPDAERRAFLRSALRERQGPSGGFVAARPFMRPAFDENREAVIRKIGEVLGVGLEAEAKRLAGPNHDAPTILSAAA